MNINPTFYIASCIFNWKLWLLVFYWWYTKYYTLVTVSNFRNFNSLKKGLFAYPINKCFLVENYFIKPNLKTHSRKLNFVFLYITISCLIACFSFNKIIQFVVPHAATFLFIDLQQWYNHTVSKAVQVKW